LDRKTEWKETMWMKGAFIVIGCIFLAAGCAHVQKESQPVSEASPPSQMQAASEQAPAGPPAKEEVAAPKHTESSKINGLQVKEKPQKKCRTVAVLEKGDPMEIKGKSGPWVNVVTRGGQEGWVDSTGLTGFTETTKPKATAPAQTPAKAKPAVRPVVGPTKAESAPKVSDSIPAPPRVSDSDAPPKAPVSDADKRPKKVSDSE
jgi:hypothetical protein